MVQYQAIGRFTSRTESYGKTTGSAEYTPDIDLPGMLWAKVLRSPVPHAIITRIDTSKAAALPGVHAVVTGDDVAGVRYGRRYRDLNVLSDGHIRFIGDRIAAVAAETKEIAEAAIDLIEVEYDELPGVFDPFAASEANAPLVHPDVNTYEGLPEVLSPVSNVFIDEIHGRGDVEAGFAKADKVIENTFTVSRQHQGYMEPHCCVAWLDDGMLQVWAPNKNPHGVKGAIALAVDMAPGKVKLNPITVGGDFGGKGATLEEPLTCLLAIKSGRPVKHVFSYYDEFTVGAPRHAGSMRFKTGVMNDGTIVAHELDAVFDGGAYGGVRPGPQLTGAAHGGGCYRMESTRLRVRRVYTNNLPGGQARAPGEPQGFFAGESHIDLVARAIGMDPVAFRMQNMVKDGEQLVSGATYRDVRASEALQAAADGAGYATPKPANVGRGVAMGYRAPGTGESSVTVFLKPGGEVLIGTPVFEPGTGTYTTLRVVVAETLGFPPEKIDIQVLGTDVTGPDSGIGGSRGTRITTISGNMAATDAKEQLLTLAASLLEWPAGHITLAGEELIRDDTGERRLWGDVLAEADQEIRADAYADATARPDVTGFVAQVAEVAVDPETGRVDLLKFTTVHDVGTIINPIGHQGQINGGFLQGMGYALMEEVQVENGQVMTTNFADVKFPTTGDLPELKTVLLEPSGGVGPYSVKGIGENPLTPVAAAIANAVEDAIGVRIRDLPITAEKVFAALKAKTPSRTPHAMA
jgi:CO/xanthine dehydrogenase Mo-binding subunit